MQNLNRYIAHLKSSNIKNPHLGFYLFILPLPNYNLPFQENFHFLLAMCFQPQKIDLFVSINKLAIMSFIQGPILVYDDELVKILNSKMTLSLVSEHTYS
jgi:hypothetical protein